MNTTDNVKLNKTKGTKKTKFFSFVKPSFHSLLQSKKLKSGEISKEPCLDILLTDLEQSSFSLLLPEIASSLNDKLSHLYKLQDTTKLKERLLPLPVTKTNDVKINYVFVQFFYLCFGNKQVYVKTSSSHRTQNRSFFKGKQTFKQKVLTLTKLLQKLYENDVFVTSFYNKHGVKLTVSNSENKATHLKTSSYLFNVETLRYKNSLFVNNKSLPELLQSLSSSKNISNSVQKIGPMFCLVKVGDYVHCGDKIGYSSGTPIIISESGKILKISETQITIQKMQPVLFYSQAEIHVESNEWVKRGTPILTLAHQTLVTGDIVQGIPRIEQLFEASTSAPAALQGFSEDSEDDLSKLRFNHYLKSQHTESKALSKNLLPSSSFFTEIRNGEILSLDLEKRGVFTEKLYASEDKILNENSTAHLGTEEKPMLLYQTLQSQVRETFRKKWDQLPLPVAVRQSLEEIQQIIVESIQKVYLSQGVLIADKHIEIIVRQMTSKAQIFDGGSTGLLIDEILSLQQIENANISTPGQKALYLPVIMGLTRAALSSDSFVSAASFQETTRVLSRDAVAGKTDFLRGLKEKVIIGDLIDAGTGLDTFYIYSLFSKKVFENKFRDILNRKITHKTLKKLVLTVAK